MWTIFKHAKADSNRNNTRQKSFHGLSNVAGDWRVIQKNIEKQSNKTQKNISYRAHALCVVRREASSWVSLDAQGKNYCSITQTSRYPDMITKVQIFLLLLLKNNMVFLKMTIKKYYLISQNNFKPLFSLIWWNELCWKINKLEKVILSLIYIIYVNIIIS